MGEEQKIRTRVIKGPEVRFISHLDFMNTIIRALRRAELPVAFSQGYNPRPQISFASALAVAFTSDSEYIDFKMKKGLSPDKFRNRLNHQLPDGIEIADAVEVPLKADSLMSIINAGRYIVQLEFCNSLSQERLEEIIDDFLGQDKIKIIRKRHNKSNRELDLKPMIFSLEIMGVKKEEATLNMLVQTGSSGNVRPQEVIRALSNRYKEIKPPKMINIHRTGLYIKKGKELLNPMEVLTK